MHGALAGAEPLADSQGQGPWSPGHRALPAPLPRQGGLPKQRRPLCAVRRRATKPDELASQRSATALSHEGWARLRQCRPRSRKAGLGHPETPLGAPPCAGTLRGARGRAHGGDVAGTRLGRGVRVSEGPSAREDSAQPRRSGRAGRPAQRPASRGFPWGPGRRSEKALRPAAPGDTGGPGTYACHASLRPQGGASPPTPLLGLRDPEDTSPGPWQWHGLGAGSCDDHSQPLPMGRNTSLFLPCPRGGARSAPRGVSAPVGFSGPGGDAP